LASVVQYPCHGGDNQLFSRYDNGNGGDRIVAKHSGKCLDVLHGSLEDAAAIVQFGCTGGRNQTWTLR
jgi:hypothetical protein